jgi:DNA-binding CsgD family transcriptional regulator
VLGSRHIEPLQATVSIAVRVRTAVEDRTVPLVPPLLWPAFTPMTDRARQQIAPIGEASDVEDRESSPPDSSVRDLRQSAVKADLAPIAPSVCSTTLWKDILNARCTIVDAFEADGRHYVVARRRISETEPSAVDPTDGMILMARAFGASLKVIALELGLSVSTVDRRLRRAMAALGFRSPADLAAAFRAPRAVPPSRREDG